MILNDLSNSRLTQVNLSKKTVARISRPTQRCNPPWSAPRPLRAATGSRCFKPFGPRDPWGGRRRVRCAPPPVGSLCAGKNQREVALAPPRRAQRWRGPAPSMGDQRWVGYVCASCGSTHDGGDGGCHGAQHGNGCPGGQGVCQRAPTPPPQFQQHAHAHQHLPPPYQQQQQHHHHHSKSGPGRSMNHGRMPAALQVASGPGASCSGKRPECRPPAACALAPASPPPCSSRPRRRPAGTGSRRP